MRSLNRGLVRHAVCIEHRRNEQTGWWCGRVGAWCDGRTLLFFYPSWTLSLSLQPREIGLAVGLCSEHVVILPTYLCSTQPSIAAAISIQWRLEHVSAQSWTVSCQARGKANAAMFRHGMTSTPQCIRAYGATDVRYRIMTLSQCRNAGIGVSYNERICDIVGHRSFFKSQEPLPSIWAAGPQTVAWRLATGLKAKPRHQSTGTSDRLHTAAA